MAEKVTVVLGNDWCVLSACSVERNFRGSGKSCIDNWFDEPKALVADFRRALRHHKKKGFFPAEKAFGVAIKNIHGNQIPLRYVGEQHVREALGRIPTAADWLS